MGVFEERNLGKNVKKHTEKNSVNPIPPNTRESNQIII